MTEPRTASPAARGFTLVELMVTLSIVAMVMVTVYFTFFRSQANAQRMNALIESRQNARSACQLMERELRMAGSGWGKVNVNVYYSGQTAQLNPVDAGYAGTNTSDTLSIVGAFAGAGSKLRANMTTNTEDIPVQSIDGLNDSDLVVVTDGANAHMFQVTGRVASPAALQHSTSSPWNPSGLYANWPVGGYSINSDVYKATWAQYRFDSTGFTRPSLVRIENNGPPQVVAQTVRGFEVWYLMQDGTLTRNPANWAMVDKVRPVVHISFENANRQTIQDSVWAIAKPRTY